MAWAAGQSALPPPRSQKNSPEITSGRVIPLLESNLARPLRYSPVRSGFKIENGSEFFNRPLYGPNIPFRVDGGDRPEFSLYLPGHGGNLRLGIVGRDGSAQWLFACRSVVSHYVEGRLIYEVSDPLLGQGGLLRLECLTLGAGLCAKITAHGVAEGLALTWAYGGVSGRKGRRNGDIGCEVQPVSEFFQMRPEECRGNTWTVADVAQVPHGEERRSAEVQGAKARLRFTAPRGAVLRIGDASHWNDGWAALWASADGVPAVPLLLGQVALATEPVLVSLSVIEGAVLPQQQAGASGSLRGLFSERRTELSTIARKVVSRTPDAFLDGSLGALCVATDALWDEAQGCVMHGAVAWRMPLAGWRGPYALDATGDHDRMRRHVRHWIARQNVTEVTNGTGGTPGEAGFQGIEEATGKPDPGSHGSRTEALLHSNGDLSHNHYDMNLVFFDAVLRHLLWTGDIAFAREVWPALERHAAWERRLFRREYGQNGESQPLYEAYAAIWASDNLQYNGGGATHSSAYNAYLNRGMARLAEKLGEQPEVVRAYQNEAQAIERAMRAQLWMADRGAFAESREWLGDRLLAVDPAVWTMYQALDSEVPNALEAWQSAEERLRALRAVPVIGEGVPADAGWQIGCSDWQPYVWSLTLLVLAENLATALGLFQAGMADAGYALLRGSLLDAGFRGLCPGNFPMSLQLDPHRQESQRDFGDPLGCAARVFVEGLWGIHPDLLTGTLHLRPQLPLAWERAEFSHPDVTVSYEQKSCMDRWRVTSKFSRPVRLQMTLRAHTTDLPEVHVNGQRTATRFDEDAVGEPRLLLSVPHEQAAWEITLRWKGAKPTPPPPVMCTKGERVSWPKNVQTHELHDPQSCLQAGAPTRSGKAVVFARQAHGACRFWLPLRLQIVETSATQLVIPQRNRLTRYEPVALRSLFSGHVRDILTRNYDSPRSGLCSLGLPSGLLGGWANFDATAEISDAGLRGAGGTVRVGEDLVFFTPSDREAPNCCFLSHWAKDKPEATVGLQGRARSLHLLIAGTTFPQATLSTHATVEVRYKDDGAPTRLELRSPAQWWPVEQDYMVDDYLFRLGPEEEAPVPLPWRVDLLTGNARQLEREQLRGKGGPIKGGSAFVVDVSLDADRELAAVRIKCNLYGVVLGLLGLTLGR